MPSSDWEALEHLLENGYVLHKFRHPFLPMSEPYWWKVSWIADHNDNRGLYAVSEGRTWQDAVTAALSTTSAAQTRIQKG